MRDSLSVLPLWNPNRRNILCFLSSVENDNLRFDLLCSGMTVVWLICLERKQVNAKTQPFHSIRLWPLVSGLSLSCWALDNPSSRWQCQGVTRRTTIFCHPSSHVSQQQRRCTYPNAASTIIAGQAHASTRGQVASLWFLTPSLPPTKLVLVMDWAFISAKIRGVDKE